ncbi:5-amino-6-(5-phosphoribosylamino)uracil reductase [Methanocalculus chunghsingensis]|uniref:5-amino-6-(5-phosphoribosylamino)uracil reductase n=1 Tax=Methanocalculus chunghsingensis TaxID=156457 RepID=A0A8J7W5N2_9EURY|nr:dihydrofolate reductase family protein [Methanocalculus chunghsingensis]MBR1368003.1 5-amino-6-(5-phosphoribosylamino)uracil reductase [Methanocalculus chunghsingensis]
MIPKVIVHSSISLDNAVTGFDIDIELHYARLHSLSPDAVLVGSTTARTGIEMFMDAAMPEEPEDMKRPLPVAGDTRPLGIFVDSTGVLLNQLHFYRRMEHIRDVIVLISEATPAGYVAYLREREYPYIVCGREKVDIAKACRIAGEAYGISCIVSESGRDLNDYLIQERIADEISLLLTPVIAGPGGKRLFATVQAPVTLDLFGIEDLGKGRVHLRYRVVKEDVVTGGGE